LKLTEEKTHYESNVDQSESLDMGIGDTTVVIEILRNRLYENKVRTLVQEYMCNARDAHREANQAKPIEVTMPTQEKPEFIVRDYGLGITPKRMATVFVLYGASTKRQSNKQTGGFGIGAKSAWSYTDSFTITTFVDGIKRVYLAHVGVNKNGRVDLVSESVTEEPNGTSISITVNKRDVQDFASAIIRGTMYWTKEEYPTFVNSSPWNTDLTEARRIGVIRFFGSNLAGVRCGQYTGNNSGQIVIDGIPYSTPNIGTISQAQTLRGLAGCSNLTVFIPNGLVQVSASREKIDDSEFSKRGLSQVFCAALAEFEKAKSRWEEAIVDGTSLITANENAAGFSLTSKKHVDYVSLVRGLLQLRIEEERDEGNVLLFSTKAIDKNIRSYASFEVNGKHRYYMVKNRQVAHSHITNWISLQPNIDKIDLVTVLAQHPVAHKDKDGNEWRGYKRSDELADELVESLKRLGYKDILEILPREARQVREKKEPVVGNFYRVNASDEDKIFIKDVGEKKGTWLYFLGTRYSPGYEEFVQGCAGLKNLGEIQDGYRVINKYSKQIIQDDRFVEYSEFIKTWKPSREVVLRFLRTDRSDYGHSSNRIRSAVVSNLLEFSKQNKESSLYKASIVLNTTSECRNRVMSARITCSPEYKAASKAIVELNTFINAHLPLIDCSSKYCSHMNEYIKWALDKASKNGVELKLLEALY
jgi:hypothetical protein